MDQHERTEMENDTALSEQQLIEAGNSAAALHESVTKAFASMGNAMLQIANDQRVMAETVNQVITDRNDLVALVGRLVEQIEALTKLQDSDHGAIEVLMAMKGMPGNASSC